MIKTALIIGATSSLAIIFCRYLAESNWKMVLCGRNKTELELLAFDLKARYDANTKIIVSDLSSKNFKPKDIITKAKPFNNIFVFAGYMPKNNFQNKNQLINKIINVNYLSIVEILEYSIDELMKYKDSNIVVMSSVAGDRGRKNNYIYGSTKSGINEYLSGLRNRVFDLDINVITIKLGFVDTPMTFNISSRLIAKRSYVAKKIILTVTNKKNVVYIPYYWKFIMLVIKLIPENLFKRLNI